MIRTVVGVAMLMILPVGGLVLALYGIATEVGWKPMLIALGAVAVLAAWVGTAIYLVETGDKKTDDTAD